MVTPLLGNGPNINQTQIPAYVVSGIGFLAGGVIFKERLSVGGLNTVATIWCTAVCRPDAEERVRAATIARRACNAMVLHAVYSDDLEAERIELQSRLPRM